MPVTADQARMLTTLAVAARPRGAPRWDPPGVMAALRKVSHLALADVALATIRAADDATAATPAVIAATDSLHWAERNTSRPAPPQRFDASSSCDVCGLPEPRCRANPHAGHDFESIAAARRRLAQEDA